MNIRHSFTSKIEKDFAIMVPKTIVIIRKKFLPVIKSGGTKIEKESMNIKEKSTLKK